MTTYPKMPMADYLSLPAVSASVLKRMVDDCPAAAWYDSWLNAARVDVPTEEMDAGTIAHAILLEGAHAGVQVIDPNDHPAERTSAIPDGWTNKSIRTARDSARASGLIPVLKKDMAVIELMVGSARRYIESLKDSKGDLARYVWEAFQPGNGHSEYTVSWLDDDIPCKIRPDRISRDHRLIIDVKTTATNPNPDRWARTQMIGQSGYLSAAFYQRGCQAVLETEPEYVFLVIGADPPYFCSLVGVDPAGLALGHDKVMTGLDMWRKCVERGEFPAYAARVHYPETPAWVQSEWAAKLGDGMEFYDRLFGRMSA